MKCKNCGSKRNVNKIDGVQICMICNAEKTIRSADDKLIDMLAELMDREEERRKNDSLALERAEDLYRYALEEDSTFALAVQNVETLELERIFESHLKKSGTANIKIEVSDN